MSQPSLLDRTLPVILQRMVESARAPQRLISAFSASSALNEILKAKKLLGIL
jgi:hypothetical protein